MGRDDCRKLSTLEPPKTPASPRGVENVENTALCNSATVADVAVTRETKPAGWKQCEVEDHLLGPGRERWVIGAGRVDGLVNRALEAAVATAHIPVPRVELRGRGAGLETLFEHTPHRSEGIG